VWGRFSFYESARVLEIFDDPIAEVIFWTAVGAALVAVGVYVTGKFRAETAQQ
jgi:hypothetical protein